MPPTDQQLISALIRAIETGLQSGLQGVLVIQAIAMAVIVVVLFYVLRTGAIWQKQWHEREADLVKSNQDAIRQHNAAYNTLNTSITALTEAIGATRASAREQSAATTEAMTTFADRLKQMTEGLRDLAVAQDGVAARVVARLDITDGNLTQVLGAHGQTIEALRSAHDRAELAEQARMDEIRRLIEAIPTIVVQQVTVGWAEFRSGTETALNSHMGEFSRLLVERERELIATLTETVSRVSEAVTQMAARPVESGDSRMEAGRSE